MSRTMTISLPFGYGIQRARLIDADSYPRTPMSKPAYAAATEATLCVGAMPARAGSLSTHGVVKRGKRFYAVHTLALTDQIAAQTRKTGNWQKLQGNATRARVIRNYR